MCPRFTRRIASAALSSALVIALVGCDDESITASFGPSIGIALDAGTLTVEQGESGSVVVTVSRRGGYSGAVALAITGLPDGVTAAFDPPSVTGATTSTLTLAVAADAVEGTYPLTVTASGAGVASRSASLGLTIAAPPASPFIGVVLGSGALSLVQGQSDIVSVTVSSGGGFSGSVALAVSGAPPGVTASVDPTTVGGAATSTLTVAAASNAAPGTYTITVTGSGSGVANASAALTLTITPAPPGLSIGLLIRDATDEIWVVRGASKTWEVIVTRGGGFAGTVDLSIEGLPAGVTAQFLPPAVDASMAGGALVLTAAASAATGTSDVVIRARAAGVPDATLAVRLAVLTSTP